MGKVTADYTLTIEIEPLNVYLELFPERKGKGFVASVPAVGAAHQCVYFWASDRRAAANKAVEYWLREEEARRAGGWIKWSFRRSGFSFDTNRRETRTLAEGILAKLRQRVRGHHAGPDELAEYDALRAALGQGGSSGQQS